MKIKVAFLLFYYYIFFSSCSLLNKHLKDNFDCARYTIFHDLKNSRKLNSDETIIIQGVTKYCDDRSIAKGTIVRIVDENDKVLSYAKSDDKGYYKLSWKSGAYKISALNPGGGIVETALIDFGFYSMSTKINLYMQHPNAFIEKMENPTIKKD